MKKINPMLLLLAAGCFLTSSCEKEEEETSGINTPIANYLYGVEYDDYDLQANVEHSNNELLPAYPACTEVRKAIL